jgi:hypothetical protein
MLRMRFHRPDLPVGPRALAVRLVVRGVVIGLVELPPPIERVSQLAPRLHEPRTHRRGRHTEGLRHLLRGHSFELYEHESRALLRWQSREGMLEDAQFFVRARIALRMAMHAPTAHGLPQRLEHSAKATLAAALAKCEPHRDAAQPVATARPPIEGPCNAAQVEEGRVHDIVGIRALPHDAASDTPCVERIAVVEGAERDLVALRDLAQQVRVAWSVGGARPKGPAARLAQTRALDGTGRPGRVNEGRGKGAPENTRAGNRMTQSNSANWPPTKPRSNNCTEFPRGMVPSPRCS